MSEMTKPYTQHFLPQKCTLYPKSAIQCTGDSIKQNYLVNRKAVNMHLTMSKLH